MVTAIAAPTPMGARYMTYPVYLNMISASDSQNLVTGWAFTPMAEQAMPKRMANTTICKTSPRAMESMMLEGKVCSRMSPALSLAAGMAAAAAPVLLIVSPAPGWARFTAARPTNKAMVVITSKYTIAFSPMRPICLMSPAPAIP